MCVILDPKVTPASLSTENIVTTFIYWDKNHNHTTYLCSGFLKLLSLTSEQKHLNIQDNATKIRWFKKRTKTEAWTTFTSFGRRS